MTNAKDYEAETKWLNTSEAKQRIAAAKAHAISEFIKRFPHADIKRFQVEVELDTNRKATRTVLFTESDGSQTDPLIKDGKYWSQALKDALGFHQDGGFPLQLTPFIQNKIKKPIPAVDFSEEIQSSIGDVLNKELRFTNRILYHQVQRNLQEDTDQIHNRKICKKVARRLEPELLATAAKLCSVVRNNRLWNFS